MSFLAQDGLSPGADFFADTAIRTTAKTIRNIGRDIVQGKRLTDDCDDRIKNEKHGTNDGEKSVNKLIIVCRTKSSRCRDTGQHENRKLTNFSNRVGAPVAGGGRKTILQFDNGWNGSLIKIPLWPRTQTRSDGQDHGLEFTVDAHNYVILMYVCMYVCNKYTDVLMCTSVVMT